MKSRLAPQVSKQADGLLFKACSSLFVELTFCRAVSCLERGQKFSELNQKESAQHKQSLAGDVAMCAVAPAQLA